MSKVLDAHNKSVKSSGFCSNVSLLGQCHLGQLHAIYASCLVLKKLFVQGR